MAPGDLDALADAMRKLTKDPEHVAQMGALCIGRFSLFDWRKGYPILLGMGLITRDKLNFLSESLTEGQHKLLDKSKLIEQIVASHRRNMSINLLEQTQNNNGGFNFYTFLLGLIQHYNDKSYWRMREEVVNPHSKKSTLVRLWYLFRIKRSDAFANASMGTNLNSGAKFASKPNLPHHLNGIIISHYANIGKNCTIYQQVTIAQDENNKSATIGDNVFIGAGAKIIGAVTIGDNVKIGANAVVVEDIPANCTAVGVPARIIPHELDK